MVPKTLAERTHACPNGGLKIARDLNASLNIRTLGLRGRAYGEMANNRPLGEVGSPGL